VTNDTPAPDFFLASSESYDLEGPRVCWRIRRLATVDRDDLLLIRIAPPLIGQKYGMGAQDIDEVVVAARHRGSSLFPISEWPIAVHVARLKKALPANNDQVGADALDLIAWAELYPTAERAQRKR